MKNVLLVVLPVIFLSGCAVKPLSSTQSADTLTVALSRSKKSKYSLVDERGVEIAEAQGKDGVLEFSLIGTQAITSCVHVRDEKGKKIGTEQYRLPLLNKYREVDRYKSVLESRNEKYSKQYSTINKRFQNAKIKLEGHTAFSNRRCHLPERRPLPPMPNTRCSTYNECLEEGGAICYSRFIGAEGCSLALRELNVSGMLASPSCAAVAAELAGQKYDMEDAFVDFLHGVADDVGSGLLKSESLFENILGLLVFGTNYGIKLENARACTDNFVQRHYGPRLVWQQRVKEIRLEPQKAKSNCENLITQHNRYYEELNEANSNLQLTRAKLVDLNVIHEEIADRVIKTPKCTDKSFELAEKEGIAKRYLIGVSIDIGDVAKKNDRKGVYVSSLVDGSPAQKAGIRKGDTIFRVDESPVNNLPELTRAVQKSSGLPLVLTFSRDGKLQKVELSPTVKEIQLLN